MCDNPSMAAVGVETGVATSADSLGRPTGRSAWLLVLSATFVCLFIAVASGTHLGLVVIGLPLIVALIFQSPTTILISMPVWMVMLGLVRRLTPGGSNIGISGDPVLLIGPVVLILLFAIAANRGALRDRTRFANAVGALGILAFFEAFNPKQGSVLAGLAGLLFILVPLLAFWVGRHFLDAEHALLIVRSVAILSLFAAIYGLIQQFHGLPSWDVAWTQSKGYSALNVGQVQRAFGPFSSAQEYAAFLTVGLVAWLATARKATRMFTPLHLGAICVVAVALWFESERTAVFLAVLAIGVMGAARLRLRPWGVALGGAGAVIILIALGGHLGGGGSGTTGALNNHLLTGIRSPLGAQSSLSGHIRATRIGILQGFKNPLGHGTGSVTLASTRFNGAGFKTVGTEYDPGNMGIAFGIGGLFLYPVIAWYAIRTSYRAAVRTDDVVAVFTLGILMGVLFEWTNGDLYSVCWVLWLFLGYLDMKMLRASREAALEPAVAPAFEWRKPGPRGLPNLGG